MGYQSYRLDDNPDPPKHIYLVPLPPPPIFYSTGISRSVSPCASTFCGRVCALSGIHEYHIKSGLVWKDEDAVWYERETTTGGL